MARYHALHAHAPEDGAIIADTLEAVAREGAGRLLEQALRAAVGAFLGRACYERGGLPGDRNGYGRPRDIGIRTPVRPRSRTESLRHSR